MVNEVDKDENINECYWEYLKRYYSNDPLSELSSKKTDYDKALETAIADLISEVNKKNFNIDNYGGADSDLQKYLTANGITLTDKNIVHALTVPYVYLPNEDGINTVGTGSISRTASARLLI